MPSLAAEATIRKWFHEADAARRSPADGFTLWRSRAFCWDDRPLPTHFGSRGLLAVMEREIQQGGGGQTPRRS